MGGTFCTGALWAADVIIVCVTVRIQIVVVMMLPLVLAVVVERLVHIVVVIAIVMCVCMCGVVSVVLVKSSGVLDRVVCNDAADSTARDDHADCSEHDSDDKQPLCVLRHLSCLYQCIDGVSISSCACEQTVQNVQEPFSGPLIVLL
ncbi:hypothetical protein ACFQHN_29465 [Natrialbaceae archaeon GCM10025896]